MDFPVIKGKEISQNSPLFPKSVFAKIVTFIYVIDLLRSVLVKSFHFQPLLRSYEMFQGKIMKCVFSEQKITQKAEILIV